ncbi:hypothetical protein EYF80_028509 [Liparis tanakae]|uniref:Uncharacterized protein n=1 Tax=Liparis tanakae TaxID=230148 RepID=A0A4Z2H6E1_9TELE|nr:hypothetical protein EYF80_028509 [Liparis tanakae]
MFLDRNLFTIQSSSHFTFPVNSAVTETSFHPPQTQGTLPDAAGAEPHPVWHKGMIDALLSDLVLPPNSTTLTSF